MRSVLTSLLLILLCSLAACAAHGHQPSAAEATTFEIGQGGWADEVAADGLVAESVDFDNTRASSNQGTATTSQSFGFTSFVLSGEALSSETGMPILFDPTTGLDAATNSIQRKMIYTAGLNLQVSKVETAILTFLSTVESFGGYISGRVDSLITARIPVARFPDFITTTNPHGPLALRELA